MNKMSKACLRSASTPARSPTRTARRTRRSTTPPPSSSPRPPIVLDVVDGRKAGSLYTRYGLNPTIFALEAKLAAWRARKRPGPSARAWRRRRRCSSPTAAKGIACIGDAYGGTLELIASQLPLFGVRTHLLLGSELDLLEACLREGCGLVFLETPTNPRMEMFDIAAIAELAHRHGARLAVDNTFASPVNQRPLELGADFVVHSATKYLGGHSDITAGALMGSKELLAPVWNWRKNLGQMIAPETPRCSRAACARWWCASSGRTPRRRRWPRRWRGIRRSRACSIPACRLPRPHLAKRQMKGFGGMLSIEVKGGGERRRRAWPTA
jgi:cystathionine gamma-synthase